MFHNFESHDLASSIFAFEKSSLKVCFFRTKLLSLTFFRKRVCRFVFYLVTIEYEKILKVPYIESIKILPYSMEFYDEKLICSEPNV